MKWIQLYLSSQQVCFWFITCHLKSGRPLLLGVLLWILSDQTCPSCCWKLTAGKRYHSLDRNVLGLFQGFTYTHTLFLINTVNRSKVYIWPKYSFFHWEKLLLPSKGGSCSAVVVTKWKGNTCHSGGFSCIFPLITKTDLRNYSLDEGDFFSSLPVSAKCMPRNAARCSILLIHWASPVRVFPMQKRYSHTPRAVFSLNIVPKCDRIEARPSPLRFHGQWHNPPAPDSSWPQASERTILVGIMWVYLFVFLYNS